MRKFQYLSVLLLIKCSFVFSQVGEIRGFVYDKQTGEPIIFTNVYLKGTSRGVVTDVNGYYSLTKIPIGSYTIVSTYLGYDTANIKVEVQNNKISTVNLYIEKTTFNIKEIEVRDKRTEREKEVNISEIKITPKLVSKIPSIGGEPDFAQYLQVLPGVIFTGDQGGQIYIRGGTPVQNKVLLDGMTIYNPFHSIGLFSVFDMDYVRNIDVYTGGFNAEYGNRISAIMDIKTRDGNRKKFSGKVSTGTFNSKAILEGPIKKWEIGKGSSSFLFSSRVSYLDKTAPVIYDYADSNGLPYTFADFYGKVSFNAVGGTKASFFGFNFNDKVNFTNTTTYKWTASGAGGQFLFVPAASSTTIEGNFAYSDYQIEQTEEDGAPRFSYINGFEGGLDFNYYPGDDAVRYGVDISGFKTQFEYTNSFDRKVEQTEFTTELAGYIRYKKIINKLVIDPGFRMQYYASLQELSMEPRLGLKYNLTQYLRVKFAGGYYSQNLISARSDRDVVNLFYGFLSGPDDLPNYFRGDEVKTRLQKATHAIGGFELDLGQNSYLNVEGYLKNFTQLTNINRNKVFDNNPPFLDKPAELREDYIIEKGKAYGLDFTYQYDKSPFYFWFVYSLSYVERTDENMTYFPHWDRRHNINILASYFFGKNKSWEASLRWNYGSGFPFTQSQGFYPKINFVGQGINTNYVTENPGLGITFGPINDGRLSDYHRLDGSVKKTFTMKKDQKLEITASVINIYNRKNIFYFNRVSFSRVNQLPILPSLSVSYKW